ncbi:hypothetical protein F5880DRAFT_1619630, partial [Lentinula raphanica]
MSSDPGNRARRMNTSHNDPYCEPHGYNTDEEMANSESYPGIHDTSGLSQPEVSSEEYVRGPSTLTEAPNTAPLQTHTRPQNVVLNSLMEELLSLIQNGVKSPSMKTHFRSQINVPNIDLETLKGILDRCYRYVAERVPPAAATPEHGSDDGHISAESGPRPKLYEPPKRRSEGKNYLAELVRCEAGILLGTLVRNDTLAEPLVSTKRMLVTVSEGIVKDFEKSAHEGPTVENFILQLDKGKRTNWNKAAAEAFCKYFRSREGCGDYRRKDIYEAFMGHLTQLKRDYARQGNGKSSKEKLDEQRARRQARRQT